MHAFRHVFRFALVAAAVFFGFGQSAFSGPEKNMDAQTFMTFCSGKYDTDFGICSGYIMAIAEVMMDGLTVHGYRACGHESIKAQQLVDLVRMDVAEQKEISRQSAGAMVANILSRSFPCQDSLEPAAGQ